MKKILSIFMLLVAVTTGAWAAGYTRTLSESLEVNGFKAKQFYNFQTNTPEVLPTTGDLRYRDGGIWGLHNYGSGTRSATVTISVSEGDILVIQDYNNDATINRGTLNSSLSAGTGYRVFDISTSATDITFTTPRYGGVVAAFVMEVDESAATADYTINYLLNGEGEPVKSSTGNIAVGSTVPTEVSFFANDVKYFRANGQPESFEIAASGNIFNVNVRQAATYNYSLVSNLGGTLATGSGFEGETFSVGYPRYQLSNGVFYEAGVTNKEYRKPITLSENNVSATVDYAIKDGVNAAFYIEGESVEGMTLSTTGNIPVRASNAAAGIATEDVAITTLPAGKYVVHAGIFASKTGIEGKVVNFGIGDEVFSAAFTAVNLNEVASEEYTLSKPTEVKFIADGTWGDAQFDYIWIERTGNPEVITITIPESGLATFSSAYTIDMSKVQDLSVYVVTEVTSGSALCAPLKDQLAGDYVIPANTGVILEGTKGATYNLPVIASGEAPAATELVACVEATEVEGGSAYVLYGGKFCLVETTSNVPAGKAYLPAGINDAKTISLSFGGVTGISEAEAVEASAAAEGKFVENGKLVIVKNGRKFNAAGAKIY